MTTWLCGVEQRWTMAAPSCFVTTFRRNMENELPADTEQCPPRALFFDLDHDDFLAAMAPKPVIILAKERDYFDVRGSIEAFRRLKRLYTLLGAEQNVELFIGPTYHGFSQENREAMYRWFNRATGISDTHEEPKLVIEDDETLWCTPSGQVAEFQPRTVFSFTRETSKRLAESRRPLEGKPLCDAVAGVVGYPFHPRPDPTRMGMSMTGPFPPPAPPKPIPRRPPPENAEGLVRLFRFRGAPDYRIIRHSPPRKYPQPHAITYAVETEPGIHAIVYRLSDQRLMSRPPQAGPRAILYVSHHSADAELRSEPLVRQLLDEEPETPFFTCDVRGIGDSRPEICGHRSFLQPAGCDYFYAIHSLMLDDPYVGQKTRDVLRVLAWLESVGHPEVHLAAKGWGTIPATFAALLADPVVQVTLRNALTSYREVAETEMYGWPLSSFVPGVLESFDLPDCYRELKKTKKLRQIDPWGAAGE